MRWYVSYPILAAGLAFGFDVLYPDTVELSRPSDATIQGFDAPLRAPIVVMASEIEATPVSRVAAFSPGLQLLDAELPRPSASVLDYLAQALSPGDAEPVPPAPQPITLAAWKSAVIRTAQPAVAPPARSAEPLSRVALARDIQRELQRVGCYLGEIDGVWGGGSKRAVLVFMDRVNASLPTQDPDVFMLSLLRSQEPQVCGASCPRGQSLTAAGRCVPSTLAAQADGDKTGTSSGFWEPTVAAVSDRGPAPFGRMSIGGPKPDDVAQLSSGWSGVAGEPKAAVTRTAALDASSGEAGAVPGGEERAPNVATSSFDGDALVDAPSIKRSKSSGNRGQSRSRPARTSAYRHVQRLFEHPLGRM